MSTNNKTAEQARLEIQREMEALQAKAKAAGVKISNGGNVSVPGNPVGPAFETESGKVTRLSYKLGKKGNICVYGLGRFPVTLYGEQWETLAKAMADIVKAVRAEREAGNLATEADKAKRKALLQASRDAGAAAKKQALADGKTEEEGNAIYREVEQAHLDRNP